MRLKTRNGSTRGRALPRGANARQALEFEKLRGANRMAEIGASADAAWNSIEEKIRNIAPLDDAAIVRHIRRI